MKSRNCILMAMGSFSIEEPRRSEMLRPKHATADVPKRAGQSLYAIILFFYEGQEIWGDVHFFTCSWFPMGYTTTGHPSETHGPPLSKNTWMTHGRRMGDPRVNTDQGYDMTVLHPYCAYRGSATYACRSIPHSNTDIQVLSLHRVTTVTRRG